MTDKMSENGTVTVFVIDDDDGVRDSIQDLLQSVNLAVESFAAAKDFLDSRDVGLLGCVITDIRMPTMSGIELQKEMRQRGIDLPIIMITGHADVETGIHAMKAGAFDFIQKPFNDQKLLDTVNHAIEKSRVEFANKTELMLLIESFNLLSVREKEVLDLIVDGIPNKRIADQLELSDKTIEFHRANIMKKTEAKTLAGLIRSSLRLKLFLGEL